MNEILQKTSGLPKTFHQTIKLLIIGFIILVLMIPVAWISSLIRERHNRRDSVVQEISEKWGASQIVSGPYISVPYQAVVMEDNNGVRKTITETRYVHITAETMNVTGSLQTESHHRNIFKVLGYKGEFDLVSTFNPVISADDMPVASKLEWDKAIVSFDLSDAHGLKEIRGKFNGMPLTFENSSGALQLYTTLKPDPNGSKPRYADSDKGEDRNIVFKYQAKAPIADNSMKNQVSVHVSLTGTQQIYFLPSAMQESVDVQSDWKSPSFIGDILPESHSINEKGFHATWHTNYLSSGNKPYWRSDAGHPKLSYLGVDFLVMVDSYQQATRALKYSILFLLLTFMTFFFAETAFKQRIHPIQYVMVGCSLVLFYLLLLSISEHLPFGWSYLISAIAIILQISIYCGTILKTGKFAYRIGGMLTGLYAFLYVLLRLEDSALLVGSISLFVLLGIAMYAIRNINWYSQE